jgi:hypothetical protein
MCDGAMSVDHSSSRTHKVCDRKALATCCGNKDTKGMFPSLGLISGSRGNFSSVNIFVAEGRQLMITSNRSAAHKMVAAVALAGGAAAIALAGAGTAGADNLHNVVTNNGNKFVPNVSSATSSVGNAGTNLLSGLGTVLTNAIVQTGTAVGNGQIQVGTAGTNAITQTGTALGNGQVQVGTAGTNALTQVGTAGTNAIKQTGQAGNGLLSGLGHLLGG